MAELHDFETYILSELLACGNVNIRSENDTGRLPTVPIAVNPNKRFIFIGVGGSGIRILDQIKHICSESLQLGWNNIKFLGIDTDPFENYGTILGYAEQILIGSIDHPKDDPPPAWAQICTKEQIQALMWDMFRSGGCQARLIGKLKAHDKAGSEYIDVDKLIFYRLADIVASPDWFGQEVDVYVVGSSYGGTGGGMFLELPSIIRNVFHAGKARIYGILLLPDLIDGRANPDSRSRMESNGYATLKELDYFQGLTLREGFGEVFPFNDIGRQNQLRMSGGTRFFDLVYLLGKQHSFAPINRAKGFESEERMIADFLGSLPGCVSSLWMPYPTDLMLADACAHEPHVVHYNAGYCAEEFGESHDAPRTYGAIGFSKAALPTNALRACMIGKACEAAKITSVPGGNQGAAVTTTPPAGITNFLEADDYIPAEVGSRLVRGMLQELFEIVESQPRILRRKAVERLSEVIQEADFRNKITGDGIQFWRLIHDFIAKESDRAEIHEMEQQLHRAFERCRTDLCDYAVQYGPFAAFNLVRGNFLPSLEICSAGMQELVGRLADGRNWDGSPIWEGTILEPSEAMKHAENIRQMIGAKYMTIFSAIYRPLGKTKEDRQMVINAYADAAVAAVLWEKRAWLTGAAGILQRIFLKPLMVYSEVLRECGRVVSALSTSYSDICNRIQGNRSFHDYIDSDFAVNIADLDPGILQALLNQADGQATAIDAHALRHNLVFGFMDNPSEWTVIPENIFSKGWDGRECWLKRPDTPIKARYIFDRIIEQHTGQLMPSLGVQLNHVANLPILMNRMIQELYGKSKPAINLHQGVEPSVEHCFILRPANMPMLDPLLHGALVNHGIHAEIYDSGDVESIMMYQMAAPFEIYQLQDLPGWEKSYECRMNDLRFGLHSMSPDVTCMLQQNGKLVFQENMSWAMYPQITYHQDPKNEYHQHAHKTDKSPIPIYEGQHRRKIDRLIEDARCEGVLFSEQDEDGKWTIQYITLHEKDSWIFDASRLTPGEDGLLPTGTKLLPIIAKMNDLPVEALKARVTLGRKSGILDMHHSSEELAWEYAARTLYRHIPMLIDIRNSRQLLAGWNEEVAPYNEQLWEKQLPLWFMECVKLNVIRKDAERQLWYYLDADNAHISFAHVNRQAWLFPCSEILDSGFELAYVFMRMLDKFGGPSGKQWGALVKKAQCVAGQLYDMDYAEEERLNQVEEAISAQYEKEKEQYLVAERNPSFFTQLLNPEAMETLRRFYIGR